MLLRTEEGVRQEPDGVKRSSSTIGRRSSSGEMTDVRRGHENRNAGLTDRDGTGGEDGIGVECVGVSGRYPLPTGISPEQRGLTPIHGRDGDIDQAPCGDQGGKPIQGCHCADARQLTANSGSRVILGTATRTPRASKLLEPLAAVNLPPGGEGSGRRSSAGPSRAGQTRTSLSASPGKVADEDGSRRRSA